MALLEHQKISWVIPGKPFGRGILGSYSSATAPTMTKDSCSGTATSTTLTTAGSTFANGDLLKIIQMRGTGVGQWEIALVQSGGGSTSLTLSKALTYTYTDSGASQAQAVKINEYTDVTVQSGTWTAPTWDGNAGGVLTFAAKGTLTPTGTISANGTGFLGGAGSTSQAQTGEGTTGARVSQKTANGSGGGGGFKYGGTWVGGGGGGNGTAGADAASVWTGGGYGGTSSGDANLQSITVGGGGGGAYADAGNTPGTGAAGGGIISIFAKIIDTPTSITLNGNNGIYGPGPDKGAGGGGGAGGSLLICGRTINIGTDKLSTYYGTGATGTDGGRGGGNGAKGRIAIYYGSSLTGSVSSSYYGSLTSERDGSLIESVGGEFLLNFI